MIFKNVNIFYITRLLASAYNDCQSGLWSGQFSWSLSPINDKPPLMFCMSKARIFSSFINPKEHLLIFWNIEKAQLAKPVKRLRILKIMCHMFLLIRFFGHSPTNFKTSIFANLKIFIRNLWKTWASWTTSVSQYCIKYSNKFLHSYFW